MINPKIYNITLDLKNSMYTSDIKVKQGDIDSNIFKLKLIQDNQEYDLTGLTARAYFTRPDKTESFLDAPITNALKGEIEITLTNQILNAKGWASCELKILGTAGEVLSTMAFGFTILKSADYTEIESSNEYNALVTALNKVENLEEQYVPRLNSVESQLAETMNKTAITLTHIFADNTARDSYFTSKPLEKINLTFIKVGTGYQQLINGLWELANPVIAEVVKAVNQPFTPVGGISANNTQAAITELDTEKANKTQEAWITPTLAAPWVELNVSQKPGYYKDSLGIVRLRGLIKSGTLNTTVFFLPAGYRPEKDMYYAIVANDKPGQIVITTAGAVSFRTGETAWVAIDQISFKAV